MSLNVLSRLWYSVHWEAAYHARNGRTLSGGVPDYALTPDALKTARD